MQFWPGATPPTPRVKFFHLENTVYAIILFINIFN